LGHLFILVLVADEFSQEVYSIGFDQELLVGLVLEDDLREAHACCLLGVIDTVFQLLDDRQDTIELTKQ